MFIFVQYFKSTKEPKYSQNECSQDMQCAQEYATKLLESSIDVLRVEVFNYVGSMAKVERLEWVG